MPFEGCRRAVKKLSQHVQYKHRDIGPRERRVSGTFALLAQNSCRARITLPVCSPATLEYVAEKERYWMGERFMKHVENAANIADFKYKEQLWLFDQSNCKSA